MAWLVLILLADKGEIDRDGFNGYCGSVFESDPIAPASILSNESGYMTFLPTRQCSTIMGCCNKPM